MAYIESFEDILNEDYSKSTGKPIPLNKLGATGEIPLNIDLDIINFDELGIDPEGIVMDKDGYIWICEEYGPNIIKIDPKDFRILERFSPENGLPDILKWRQPNRGFEGVAFYDNKIYAAVQSTLDVDGKTKNLVNFVRIVELDLKTREVKTYAYPLPNDFKETDILGSRLDDKYMLKKRKILNLREFGYSFEKSEGLAVIDEKTIAIVNDNDFGIKSNISQFKSPQLINKRIVEKESKKDVTMEFKIENNDEVLELWLIKLPFSLYELRI